MTLDNCYIFDAKQKEIINIEYNTAHLFYYWSRYVVYIIDGIKKEIESNLRSRVLESSGEQNKENKEKEEKLILKYLTENSINFLFVLEEDVQNPVFYKALSSFIQKNEQRKPLISIGAFDLNDVTTYLPVYYLDSSIWDFYISIIYDRSIVSLNKNFTKRFINAIEIINNKKNFYNITIAKEFIELQDRLLGNSYLGLPGGHAAAVSPFVFHSEQIIKKKANKVINDIEELFKHKSYGKSDINIEWNVLLIDDYAEEKLKGGQKTKKEILGDLLSEIKIVINNLFKFNITSSSSINEAKKFIRNESKQYDIILLDYLLGAKGDSSNQREYGDEFLRKLETNKELLKHKGPLGKFWILPISSFSNAMLSKLEEEGIGRINNDWYIMDGADMVNTPQLFRYNFLKLIEFQLNTAIITKDDIIEFVVENLVGDYDNDKKKGKKKDNDNSLRINARRLYGLYMNRFGMKEALKADAQHGSAFAKSVLDYMDKVRYEDMEFYEKVRKLLYLIGFGTHTDVHLMWDLLTYIVASINETVSDTNSSLAQATIDVAKGLMSHVATFISNLKSDG